ncbi:MAG: ABC transporter permease [Halanaerobium sp.]|nr:ABC transporter permease [Halanaerobium sp.]
MNLSFSRIGAIFIKELQDVRKNTNVVYMYFLPVLLTLLWENFIPDMPEGFALGFGLMFLVVMVGMYVPSMIIAEEKEKGTMEVLLLSPAKPAEVFIGKGLLTFISIIITGIVLLLITGTGSSYMVVIGLGTMLTAIFAIFVGMIVGLIAPNQMATGIIGLPVYLILLLVPQFAMMGVGIMKAIGRFLPTYYFFDMLRLAFDKGQSIDQMMPQLGVLLVSIIVAFAALLLIYRRKGLE